MSCFHGSACKVRQVQHPSESRVIISSYEANPEISTKRIPLFFSIGRFCTIINTRNNALKTRLMNKLMPIAYNFNIDVI